jgi:hypothetical protein
MTTAKIRGYGVEINGALQNVSFDDAFDAEDWVRLAIAQYDISGIARLEPPSAPSVQFSPPVATYQGYPSGSPRE